jgi:hypothetical protein
MLPQLNALPQSQLVGTSLWRVLTRSSLQDKELTAVMAFNGNSLILLVLYLSSSLSFHPSSARAHSVFKDFLLH